MAFNEPTYLMFVDVKDGTQSNKFYNMLPLDASSFKVVYGRVDSTETEKVYPLSKWNSLYNSKIKKGYEDISHLKQQKVVVSEASGNSTFDHFYEKFSSYTGDLVRKTFISDGATEAQLKEAQKILNALSRMSNVDNINEKLKKLYKVIPRRMSNVRDHLITNVRDLDEIVKTNQDALDAMDSSNIMQVSNPFKELGIDFTEVDTKEMEDLLYPTMGNSSYGRRSHAKIHKVYAIRHHTGQQQFDDWLKQQKNKQTKLLIHGTRCPNVFSILKSGLLVRPTNAASFAGSAYGDGVYHSAHSQKSLGYTGWDEDKIFFIQNVHMGREYTYSGWYRDGKDISRSDMHYEGLKKRGYDSLFVKPGDGLLNSEYIVYKSEQTVTNYLVWMK